MRLFFEGNRTANDPAARIRVERLARLIAGDQSISDFIREASKKIQHQALVNAISSLAAALLISLAIGAGAAALGRTAATMLAAEGSSLAMRALGVGVDIGVNASINSVAQLAMSDHAQSFGWTMLQNSLMEA
jgi:hypothetical protein